MEENTLEMNEIEDFFDFYQDRIQEKLSELQGVVNEMADSKMIKERQSLRIRYSQRSAKLGMVLSSDMNSANEKFQTLLNQGADARKVHIDYVARTVVDKKDQAQEKLKTIEQYMELIETCIHKIPDAGI